MKTCATMIQKMALSLIQFIPIAEYNSCKFRNALNAIAVTMVGSTKGIVINTRSELRPRKLRRYKMYAPGIPSNRQIRVESAACHTVNQMAESVFGPRIVPAKPALKPRLRIRPSGQ